MAISELINAAVGEGKCPNLHTDVVTIKTLLTIVAVNQAQPGFRPQNMNGYVDPSLIKAIHAFQQAKVSFKSTGVIQPNDQTFRALVEYARGARQTVTSQRPIRVAESKRRPGFDEYGRAAKDMLFGDYTAEQIKHIRWNFSTDDLTVNESTAALHFKNFELMAKSLFAQGGLEGNIQRMIDKFRRSEGGTYSNPVLDQAVKNNPATHIFQKDLEYQLHAVIKGYRGDISRISVKDDISIKHKLFFQSPRDILGGLTIATNDIWAWTVDVVEYKFDGLAYSGTYCLTLYDHFGLDEPDVDYSKKYAYLAGFRSWFILQHLKGFAYKPFMTVMELREKFSGGLV
jgi:uncharacterized protein (TIGR03034 family)